MFANVSVWGVLLAAASAMVVGMLWYQKDLLGNQWMKLAGIDQKGMNERAKTAFPILIVVSLVTAYALAQVTAFAYAFAGGSWLESGLLAGTLCGIGFGATAVFAHGVFEPRDYRLMYINAGNRVVTLLVMGLVLGLLQP
jgi:hypothetical protein